MSGPPPAPPAPPPAPRPALRGELEITLLLVLSYLGLLAAVPYLVAPDAPLVRWHARQGLALAVLEVGCAVVMCLPAVVGFAGWVGFGGCLVLALVGLVKALDRIAWRMPVAADLADRLKL